MKCDNKTFPLFYVTFSACATAAAAAAAAGLATFNPYAGLWLELQDSSWYISLPNLGNEFTYRI